MKNVLLSVRRRMRGPFLGPVLMLTSGGAAAQGIVFLARPILTRLYSPEAFGVLSLFTTIATIFAISTTGRYEDAVLIPKRNASAGGIQRIALGAAALGALLLITLLPLRTSISHWLEAPELAPLLLVLPPVVLLLATRRISEKGLIRTRAFRMISFALVVQAIVTVTVQFAAPGHTPAGLVIGFAAGATSAAVIMAFGSRKLLMSRTNVSWRRLARRYRKFPAFGLPATLSGTVANKLPPLLLAPAFGTGFVGLFSVAYASLAVPISMPATSIGKVFYQEASVMAQDGALGPLTQRIFRRLVMVTLFPVLCVAVMGPPLFSWVYGAEWAEAGVFAWAISPWIIGAAVVSPLTCLFDILERQRLELLMGMTDGGLLLAGLLLGTLVAPPLQALIILGGAGTLARIIQSGVLIRIGQASLRVAAREATVVALKSCACLLPATIASVLGHPLVALGLTLAGALAYAVLVWKTETSSDRSQDYRMD